MSCLLLASSWGIIGIRGYCPINYIDNIASQAYLLVFFSVDFFSYNILFFLYIRNSRRGSIDVCAVTGVCYSRRVFHQELSITPLWGVGKPVVNPAGWFRLPAAADSPPQRIFFLLLFLLEVPIWLHESRQINNCIS